MPNCKQCSQAFEITESDKKFYERVSPIIAEKKYSIPEPKLCPDCRSQRRMIWRPELNLFKRKCDYSGKMTLSMYPPEADCVVYSHDEWWSDKWDAMDYGRDFDFNRPFFDQFAELLKTVPLRAVSKNENENCDYVNSASWNKNSYLISGASYNQDCYYGNSLNHCNNCVDNNFLDHCELCYECIDSVNCFNLKYSFNCNNCSDSYFLYNCRNCKNCFGSVDLVGKQYCFMNEQLKKDEYEKRLSVLQLDRRSRVEEAKQFFEKHRLKYPYKYMQGEQNENVTGNCLNQCINTFESFDVSGLEDCKYCTWLHQSKNSMDIYAWGFSAEESYECIEVGSGSYHALFSFSVFNGTNVMYSCCTSGAQDIFGCVGLRNKKYCVFNKQYSKEEYEKLVSKIIEHMKSTGEWGEFFPLSITPFFYNQTIAQDNYPIDKKIAEKLGAKWNDKIYFEKPSEKINIPDSINDIDESICNKILTCEKTGKPYKIIIQEFKFYKENNIPIPAFCFEVRHKKRLNRRNPHRLWERKCDKCAAAISTSYSPDRPEKVFCEKCYLETVY